MAFHQNTSVDTTKLILGNYKIETAAYSATAATGWVNLGAGIISKFGHNVTKYDVQAGNAPDPIEGVSDETFTIEGELIEFDASVYTVMMGGLYTSSAATSATTIHGGGNQTITPRAFRLTNTRMVSGVTKETVIIVYKATFDNGISQNVKSDNDADPISVLPFAITAKVDSTRTAGSQLFELSKWTS